MAIMFALGCTNCAYADQTPVVTKTNVSGSVDNQQDYVGITKYATLSKDKDELNFSVKNITEKSAKLVWNSNSVSITYSVYVQNPITTKYDLVASTALGELALKNLSANVTYNYLLAVKDTNNFVGSVTFTTNAKKPVLKMVDASSNSVDLKVSNVAEKAVVDIYRGKSAGDMKKIASVVGNGEYTDKNLKGNTNYVYKAVSNTVRANTQEVTKTESKKVYAHTLQNMGLPAVSGRTKTYAIYTAVTVKSSPQYKLLNSSKCYTDPKTGIRMVDDCYCIALGSYYGSKIGTKYKITLSTGKSFKAILCDQKANRHTDANNQYAVRNKDVVEFYVKKSMIPKSVRGNYGRLEQFKGDIVKIEKY